MQVNLSCVFTGGLFVFPLLTYLPVYNEADTCKMKDHVRLLYEPTLINKFFTIQDCSCYSLWRGYNRKLFIQCL